MSKQANARRLPGDRGHGARCVTSAPRPAKLNLVAQSIRGLKVQRALNELEFSHKRIAKDVRKALYSAISNAENNHNLDIDSPGRRRGLRGQEPGDEALLRPRPRSRLAHRKAVLARSPSWSANWVRPA